MIKHLYEIFAEKWYHGGSIYVYSDPHFGDLDSYKLRFKELSTEFKSVEQFEKLGLSYTLALMSTESQIKALNEMQIDNINKKVHKNDTLIILGDVGDPACVAKLKAGHKVLIMGNHDAGRSNYERIKGFNFITKIWSSTRPLDYTESSLRFLPEDDFDKLLSDLHEQVINRKIVSYEITSKTYVDNHLFDEVYEGELTAGPKLKFSHEPLEHSDFCLNIHGHNHTSYQDEDNLHFNAIAECLNYSPIRLEEILNKKLLKNVPDIHRKTIDKATERKAKRNKGVLYAGKPATDKDPVMAESKHYNSFEEFQKGI